MTKEQEITKNMKLLKLSREEAEQLYIDDHSDEAIPEVAEMEKKAKTLKRRYEGDTTNKKSPTRAKKVDLEKKWVISVITTLLEGFQIGGKMDMVKVTNDQKEITFSIGENDYSLTLTKHRKKS